MPGERPDYNKLSAIQGLDGTTLRVVAVDASGRIIMLPYGVLDVIGTVDVNQIDSTRTVQGLDGAVLRTLVVDGSGRLIMVPIGASGNYMSVDASGYLSSIMKGIDGVTLRTIAVDAAGNILGLLQGDYMGAVKTLAVDAQGRMLAVLTDPEDVFGNPHYLGAAELAVRLGSINTYDRLGNVIFMDSFENGLNKWNLEDEGGGSGVKLTTKYCKNGAFAAKLYTAAGVNYWARMTHYLAWQVVSKVGLEVSFTSYPTDVYIQFTWYAYYDPSREEYSIRYDTATGVLQYLGSDVAWHTFATGVHFYDRDYHFNTIKLILDLINRKYARAKANDAVYDLSAYAPATYAYTGLNFNYVGIRLGNQAVTANAIYADDVIVTQKED
jgi:hypothetical protein